MNSEEFVNLAIGKKWEVGSLNIKVVEDKIYSCKNCIFNKFLSCKYLLDNGFRPGCKSWQRKDEKNVIFIKCRTRSLKNDIKPNN